MTNSLKVALLNRASHTDKIEEFSSIVYHVDSLKDLVRLLIEKDVDVVVACNQSLQVDKWKKIASTYQVPFLAFGHEMDSIHDDHILGAAQTVDELKEVLCDKWDAVLRFKSERELQRMHFVLEKTTQFNQRVLHTTKDLFISDTKTFFQEAFKVGHCHWVAVKATSSKLPPILKLKQELENQKVDQGSLIQDLDSCVSEVAGNDDFQIWKTNSGEYLCMLWIHESEQNSQCIILTRVQIKKRSDFESFIVSLIPFLQRRWSLCLTVGEAQSQVYKDSLTSLYNQKFLTEVVDRKIEEYRRYKTPFSILFIDVDHFKRVNDSLGHVIGSGVLQQVGELLKKQIRTSDFAFRYGGDEFIILLSHTEGEDAVNVAERIRKEVENSRFTVNGLKVRITVSIGLAFFPVHADSATEIIRIADEAMYYGKHKSRNIVYKAS